MWITLPAAGRLSPLRRMIHQAYGPFRLSGNANGGIVTIEQTGGSDNSDLVLGDVGGGLHVGGHGAKSPAVRLWSGYR